MSSDLPYLQLIPNFLPTLIGSLIIILLIAILVFIQPLIESLVSIYNWLFKYTGLETDYDYDKYKPNYTPNKIRCHPNEHKWSRMSTVRRGWNYINDKPCGSRKQIKTAINELNQNINKSETEVSTLLGWLHEGYDVVFTSCNNWRCSKCGETRITDFYCNPMIDDPSLNSPTIVSQGYNDTLKDIKKQTQSISTKREIAVEPVKIYS